ncbi:MAG: glycosyltransferase [Proteobacteria bacterium]|nr:glycosyltransferase [Pseudomonadota bacterium]
MTGIAVVIPTYNRLELLKVCLHAVRVQTLPAQEIIVVDDGSSDETVAWCRNQPDVIVQTTHRQGPSAARNRGVSVSNAEWVAFLDSDDVWLPDHLATMKSIIERCPCAGWIVGNAIITGPHLEPLAGDQGFVRAFPVFRRDFRRFMRFFPHDPDSGFWHGDGRLQALSGNWLQPSGLVIRRNIFVAHGGFNETLWRCEDMDLLMQLVRTSNATLSLRKTYLWRTGQSESLACDRHVMLLKRGAVGVIARSGCLLAAQGPLHFISWLGSLFRHISDYFVSACFRRIRMLEGQPLIQASLQSAIALLNILTPVFLSRILKINEFSEYRIFGLYLSSASGLSLTSGFWSLLPFWKTAGDEGRKKTFTAFRLNLYFSAVYACLLFALSPLGHSGHSAFENILLSVAVFLSLICLFMEQNIAFNGRGFLSAFAVSIIELTKVFAVVSAVFVSQGTATVFLIITVFQSARTAALLFLQFRFGLLNKAEISIYQTKSVLREAMPVCFAAALIAVSANFDRFFLTRALALEDFAVASAGLLSLPLVGFLEQSVFQRVISDLAFSVAAHNQSEIFRLLKSAVRQVADVAIPVTFLLCFYSREIIGLLFDSRFAGASTFLMIFSLLNLAALLPSDLIARAEGNSKKILLFAATACLLVCFSVVFGFHVASAAGAVAGGVFGLIFVKGILTAFELKRFGIFFPSFILSAVDYKFHLPAVAVPVLINVVCSLSGAGGRVSFIVSVCAAAVFLIHRFTSRKSAKKNHF